MSTPPQISPAPSSGVTPAVLGAIGIVLLAWASAFIVIRGVGPHFSGGALALARLLVGAVLLRLVLIGRPWVRPTAREWRLIIGFGVAWFGAYNVFLNIAEHTLDAGTTAMVVNTGPILIALGAGVFLGEGIPRWLAIGAGVAFVGAVLIGLGSGASRLGDGTGVFLALSAAVAYAIGVLCQKAALKRLPVAQVTWLGCIFGAVACLPFLGDLVHDVRAAPAGAIAGAVYLGVVPTALAFSAWAYALSKMPAGQLGVTTYIVPAIVVLLGFLVFHEIPAPLAMVGGVICLAGVALSRRRR
jgi:drug/metabolite transporter (DMT)-like permease